MMQQNIVIYFGISDTFLLEIAFYTVKTIVGNPSNICPRV